MWPLTRRGDKAFLIMVGCLGWAAFFLDPFLAAMGVGILGFILYDYRKAKGVARRLKELIKVNSDKLQVVLVAGEKKSVQVSLEVTTDLPLSLSSPLEEVELGPVQVRKGKPNLELLFHSEVSGKYTAQGIPAEVLGSYRFTREKGKLPLGLELKVFPRVMVALMQAALFLLRGGRGGTGEQFIPFKGPGTEYADTRVYLPGDTLHYIDWKATARQGKLMVKEFFLETGQGAQVIYDVRSYGPLSQDKLATVFLNICLGIAEQGYPVGLTVHDGEKVLLHQGEQRARETLRMAMGYVLESIRVDIEEIDLLVEPATSFELRRLLKGIKEETVRRVLEFEAEVMKAKVGEVWRFLTQFSHQLSEPKQFVLVSSLSGEVVEFLEVVQGIQGKHQLTVVQPTQPWKEAVSLEEAYRAYQGMHRIERILARHRIKLVSQLGRLVGYRLKGGGEC